MRPIKFMGKRKDGGGWVFGYYVKSHGGYIDDESNRIITHYILPIDNDEIGFYDDATWIEVIPESVGQFINVKDINDKEIYSGHICKAKDTDSKPPDYDFIGVVKFQNGTFVLRPIDNSNHKPEGN